MPVLSPRAPVLWFALLLTHAAYAAPAADAPGDARASAGSAEVESFDVGLNFASQLAHSGLDKQLSVDALIRGLREGLAGRAVTAEERDAATQFMRTARNALIERNRAAARAFLDQNANQPGIRATPLGLQYRVLAEGDPAGRTPRLTDQVTVRYRATLLDGTEFDRSDSHDRPATFRVNTLFKGWQEALLAMKPGARWQLYVPPELGYGANSPPAVPPGALLIYELELVRVEPAAAAPATARSGDSKPPAARSAAH